MQSQNRGRRFPAAPVIIVSMSLQSAIPWRVALQQSPPPLRRLLSMLRKVVVGVNHHLMRGGEFSTGDLGNFHPALTQVVLSLISGLFGAVVGGAMSVWGSRTVLSTSMANLERAEVRRLRVQCLVNVSGWKFLGAALKPGHTPICTDADQSQSMFELNKVFTLWADDPEVLTKARDYYGDMNNRVRLFNLIRSMARTTMLNFDALSDQDIGSVFTITRPAIQTPAQEIYGPGTSVK